MAGSTASFRVTSLREMTGVIIPHFDKYPLITQKRADYLLYKQAIMLIAEKKHLTEEGLQELVNIRASVNFGLSEELNNAFPNTVGVDRPLVGNVEVSHSQWLAGFASGEGSFKIGLYKSDTKLGYTVYLRFQISQHVRDIKLIESFVSYFGCETIVNESEHVKFQVAKYQDI